MAGLPTEDPDMLMVSDAFAQGLFGGGAPSAPGSSNPNMTFILQIAQFLPIIAIFYLLLIRPQQQQAKKLKAMLAGLKNGDKVVTSGGLMGTIARLDEQKVTLRVADDVKMEFVKSAIVSVVTEGPQK
jgi:preprotein translocase subunit YajC